MIQSDPASPAGGIALIGCRILDREIDCLVASGPPVVRSELLQDSLHEQPPLLQRLLVRALAGAEADPKVGTVVLVYGACGAAIVGLAPVRCRLVVPRAHDCVTLFLGSKERYAACMKADPSLLWYTPGWCRGRKMPGPDRENTLRAEWAGRFDDDQVGTLLEADREGLACHSTAAYTDFRLPGDAEQRAYAEKCAACLGWSLSHQPGDPVLLADLLNGRWDASRYLVVQPGEEIALSADPAEVVKAVPRRP